MPWASAACWFFSPYSSVPVRKQHVVAQQAVPAAHRVADDRRVGVPDVGRVVDVVDRRRRVELGHGRTVTDRLPRRGMTSVW